jgi:hypothetical protein
MMDINIDDFDFEACYNYVKENYIQGSYEFVVDNYCSQKEIGLSRDDCYKVISIITKLIINEEISEVVKIGDVNDERARIVIAAKASEIVDRMNRESKWKNTITPSKAIKDIKLNIDEIWPYGEPGFIEGINHES